MTMALVEAAMRERATFSRRAGSVLPGPRVVAGPRIVAPLIAQPSVPPGWVGLIRRRPDQQPSRHTGARDCGIADGNRAIQ